MRILKAPRQRQLRGRAVQLFGDRRELPDLLQLRLSLWALQPLPKPLVALQVHAAAFGNTIVVFARQDATLERTPRREAKADVSVERRVLALHPVAVEHVVLRLLHQRRMQV